MIKRVLILKDEPIPEEALCTLIIYNIEILISEAAHTPTATVTATEI
jgi:hypothetical protein